MLFLLFFIFYNSKPDIKNVSRVETPPREEAPMSEEDRNRLKSIGLDPEKYRFVSPEEQQARNEEEMAERKRRLMKAGARYLIIANQERYYSGKEPKPYGNGFKFTVIPSGKELIVSGNVKIMKMEND